MIIVRLTMHHFRQFYGTQSISFGHHDQAQLVTVILGENGRGKTGIYRAVIFALYGEMALDQDAEGDELVLTNLKALQEDYESGGKGVISKVVLDFIHEGQTYTIERSIFALMEENGRVIERKHDTRLYNSDKDFFLNHEEEVRHFVSRILDPRVKHYFFFDGERIEHLTRASLKQRNEIATGIKNLLKIDQLFKARDVLTQVQKSVTKALQEHSTGDYKKKLKEKLDLEKAIVNYKKNRNDITRELADIDKQMEHLDVQLSHFHDYLTDINKRKDLEKLLERKEEEYTQALQQLIQFNEVLHLLPAKDTLYLTKNKIEFSLGDQTQQASLSLELIEQILTELTCICGTTIEKDSQAYQRLSALRDSISRQSQHHDLNQLRTDIIHLLGYLENKEKQLDQLLQGIYQKEEEREELHRHLETLNQRLKDTNIKDLDQLNRKREELNAEKTRLTLAFKENENGLKTAQRQLEQIEAVLEDLHIRSGVHQQLTYKMEVVSQALKTLKDIIDKFEQEVIGDLELAATQNLSYLLDENGRMNIKQVKILDDYSLEVINHYGQPFLANISQGQRQVLSLSFITALAQVAGGSQTLEVPLFMDTPFGRLSEKHQHNLLDFLPHVCSQVILLVTDREFGEREKNRFMEQGQLGRMYRLESVEPGVTQITEHPLVKVMG